MKLDPVLIKFGVFALFFLFQAVTSYLRKQKQREEALRPPQSVEAPPPIASPTPMKLSPLPPQKPSADSPWSNLNGPFD